MSILETTLICFLYICAINVICAERQRQKIIIDTDTGIDDAYAILMALSRPEVEVIGITTVFGNAELKYVTRNVARLLELVERKDIPVYEGSTSPLIGDFNNTENYFGIDGFGDVEEDDEPDMSVVKPKPASAAVKDLISCYPPGEVSLVYLGPLTNFAKLIHEYPGIEKEIKEVFILGGNIEGIGNINPYAEFNFFFDPEAAHIALTKFNGKLKLVPWETCKNSALPMSWYNDFIHQSGEVAEFMRVRELDLVLDREHDEYILADQLLMALIIKPELGILRVADSCTVVLEGHDRGRMEVTWSETEKHVKLGQIINIVVDVPPFHVGNMVMPVLSSDTTFNHTLVNCFKM